MVHISFDLIHKNVVEFDDKHRDRTVTKAVI